jgi:hypothetical protein
VRVRTATFARYNVAGALLRSGGSLAAGLPELAVKHFGVGLDHALRAVFVSYRDRRAAAGRVVFTSVARNRGDHAY